jgi:hypothetical protein
MTMFDKIMHTKKGFILGANMLPSTFIVHCTRKFWWTMVVDELLSIAPNNTIINSITDTNEYEVKTLLFSIVFCLLVYDLL